MDRTLMGLPASAFLLPAHDVDQDVLWRPLGKVRVPPLTPLVPDFHRAGLDGAESGAPVVPAVIFQLPFDGHVPYLRSTVPTRRRKLVQMTEGIDRALAPVPPRFVLHESRRNHYYSER